MKKFFAQIFLLILLISAVVYVSILQGVFQPGNQQQLEQLSKLRVGNTLISVDVADTPSKRSKGLSGRESIEENYGMLFVFDQPSQRVFWMKGMNIPLDFIWINGERVVDLTSNVPSPQPGTPNEQLPRYSSNQPIDKVLEVKAGSITRHNIKIGDKVELLNSE